MDLIEIPGNTPITDKYGNVVMLPYPIHVQAQRGDDYYTWEDDAEENYYSVPIKEVRVIG